MHQAFVASASLKPMARQLLQDRTPAAYAGVEAYARAHASEDAGALAWLVVGYAHTLDHDYAKAIDPLNRAKPHAGDLGDYVSFYLGTSYFQAGRTAEAVATLAQFDTAYPESLLTRDAHVLYANVLLAEGRPTGSDCSAGKRPAADSGRPGVGPGASLRRGRTDGKGGRHLAQLVRHHAAELRRPARPTSN